MAYRPDLTIDNEMLTLVSEIAVLIDRIPSGTLTPRHLKLRDESRIRSIHSSAAIEGNGLSLNEVTDIINNKRVIGGPKDILEIKNAQKAYDLMNDLEPFSAKDMLVAHGIMMKGLVDLPGEFRDCGVGVYKGGVPVHIAPEHDDVPGLIKGLMEWGKNADTHPLIMSCIFHCRFEYIHPFIDGNGRMGRLWHSLILSKWRPAFAYLPIESWIDLNRKEYYNALREADEGNISVFIRFMLTMIKMAADEFVDEISYISKRDRDIKGSILNTISEDPGATAVMMAEILGVSTRTVKRYLSSMTEEGIIKRTGSDKTGHWKVIRAQAAEDR